MRQRDPDLHPLVHEAEDLLHTGHRVQRGRPVGPRLDDGVDPGGFEIGEFSIVVGGETDDLTATEARHLPEQYVGPLGSDPSAPTGRADCRRLPGEGRKPVLEDDDVIVGRGDLGLERRPGRAQRALVRRRVIGTRLPMAGNADPLPQQRVVAGHRGRLDHRDVARIDQHPVRLGRVVVVDQLATVGEPAGHDHGRADVRRNVSAHSCPPAGEVYRSSVKNSTYPDIFHHVRTCYLPLRITIE